MTLLEAPPMPAGCAASRCCADCGRHDPGGTYGPPMTELRGEPGLYVVEPLGDLWFCDGCGVRTWARWCAVRRSAVDARRRYVAAEVQRRRMALDAIQDDQPRRDNGPQA